MGNAQATENKAKEITPDGPKPKIQLTYFPVEARAEPIRLALILSSTPFEDLTVAPRSDEWKELKSKTPFGKLPVMQIDDGPMRAQSGAMLRWVGSHLSETLYPKDAMFDIEEVLGLVDDMQTEWAIWFTRMKRQPEKFGHSKEYIESEEGKKLVKNMCQKFMRESFPMYIRSFAKMIEKNGNKWVLQGDNPTIADCRLFAFLRVFSTGKIEHLHPNSLNINKTITSYVRRFAALEGVKGRYKVGIGSE